MVDIWWIYMSAARTVLALEFVCNISQCQAELIIVLIADCTSIIALWKTRR
jgi:hypothetical protein